MTQIKEIIPIDPQSLQEGLNQLHTEQSAVSSELTPEEVKEALRIAQESKNAQVRRQKYWELVKNGPVKPNHIGAEEMLEDLIQICVDENIPLTIDDQNRAVIELLTWYFSDDPRFEQASPGYSLTKGIYLFGGVGVGKTHIMSLFRAMQKHSYRMVDCTDISAQYKKDGEEGISKYFHDHPIQERNYWGHQTRGFCFDDLGVESDGRYFGNQQNVMERIIERRYRDRDKTVTHIISNLTVQQIEERYGTRIRERCREMFNIVSFPKTAISRRK